MIKKITWFVGIQWVLLASWAGAASTPEITYVQDLTKFASYDSLLIHEGNVFAGLDLYSIDDPQGMHKVYVFDAQNPVPSMVRIPHGPQFLYAFGPQTVMAVGLSAYGDPARWQSHFSLITKKDQTFTVKTTSFPDGYAFRTEELPEEEEGNEDGGFPNAIMVNQFAMAGSRMFFSLRYGENGLMEYFFNKTPRKLAPRIIMPHQILPVGDNLFVLERDNKDNIVRVDLTTEKTTRLLPPEKLYHIKRMLHLKQSNTLVATEKERLIVVDLNTFSVKQELATEGQPNGLFQLGSCLLMTTEVDRKLHFLEFSSGEAKTLLSWDLSVLGNKFENATNVVADETTGNIFVRATRSCPYCQHSPNAVVMVKDPTKGIHAACGLKAQ